MIRDMLVQKLHPGRFSDMSPKMAAIVGAVLGEDWARPRLGGLSITSDGFVVSGHHFLGDVSDLERNIHNLLEVAGLTDAERSEWDRLYSQNVSDWRVGMGRI